MTASTIPLAAEVARQAEGRLTDGQTAALIEGLDPAKFATDGAVDPALVGAYLELLPHLTPAPEPAPHPQQTARVVDLGQGRRAGEPAHDAEPEHEPDA